MTGGTGALGLHVARWLVDCGARHVVLASRRAGQQAASRVSALEAAGARVTVVSADVSTPEGVEEMFAAARREGRQVSGVVHAAGVDSVVPVEQLTADQIQAAFAAKVTGAALLDQRTAG